MLFPLILGHVGVSNDVARSFGQRCEVAHHGIRFMASFCSSVSIGFHFFLVSTEEEKMAHYAQEEKHIREENLRLQRRLQMEMERREALCRHLSESESRYLFSSLLLSSFTDALIGRIVSTNRLIAGNRTTLIAVVSLTSNDIFLFVSLFLCFFLFLKSGNGGGAPIQRTDGPRPRGVAGRGHRRQRLGRPIAHHVQPRAHQPTPQSR